jgi:ketosteroid isomerase-like protein
MSQENVEVVRGYFESLNRWLVSYWSDPVVPIAQSPELKEVFGHLDPEAEWDWLFSPETFRGREQLLQAVADWLETVTDWRVEVEELIEGSRDRVLLIGRVVARGKGSGTPVDQPIFVAVTVRNGKVARLEERTERAEALEAVGLRE